MKTLLMVAAIVLMAAVALAAPSLPIHKLGANPPIGPNPSYTGPTNDPHAIYGQWFNNAAGQLEARTHEFHDNIVGGRRRLCRLQGH